MSGRKFLFGVAFLMIFAIAENHLDLALANTYPPTPSKHFYGDANGDTGITGIDIIQHYNYILSKTFIYDTLQPNNSTQSWNTCDVDSNRGCTGGDTVILNTYLLSKSVSIGARPWILENMNLPLTDNTPGTWIPFNIDLHSVHATLGDSGRPGVSVVVEIDPTSQGTGELAGRSCNPVASSRDQSAVAGEQCVLAVTQTNWPVSTTAAPTESGTYGLALWGDGNGDIKLNVYISSNLSLDIPATTLNLKVNFLPSSNQIDIDCPANVSETEGISCPVTLAAGSGTCSVAPSDTCQGSIDAECVGPYQAPALGEMMGPGLCVAKIIKGDVSDTNIIQVNEVNIGPVWTILPSNITLPDGQSSYYQINGTASDPDLPNLTIADPGFISCFKTSQSCSFDVLVQGIGGGQGFVNCVIGFVADNSETCNLRVNVTDGYGTSITKDIQITVQNPQPSCIVFVDANAIGASDGSSWNDAFPNVQDAVNASSAGCEVWVAEGNYVSQAGDGSVVLMKDGVSIFGGFLGTEISLSQRTDPMDHPSILNGQGLLGHVISGASNSVLDGFKVINGYANDYNYCSYSLFYECNGGGMYNMGIDNLIIRNCQFSNNMAYANGAAIYNFASTLSIENCIFYQNSGGNDSGVYNETSSLNITKCIFTESNVNPLYNVSSSPSIIDCEFIALRGVPIHNEDHSSPLITNCIFKQNTSNSNPGSILNENYSSPTINGCKFIGNSGQYGGAIYNLSSSSPIIMNSVFIGNSSYYGGAIGTGYSSIINCIFSDNIAYRDGGAIDCYSNPSALIINCTFTDNRAERGGAIFNTGGNPIIKNCIFWGDKAIFEKDEIYSTNTAYSISYSDIKEGGNGTGNISLDPLFIDSDDGNLHLHADSPCRDSGDPSFDFNDPDGSRNDMGYFGGPGNDATDSDYDGMEDFWEIAFGLNLMDPADAYLDPDTDGYTNVDEFSNGINPFISDKWYVNINSTVIGSGHSWAESFNNIQAAIDSSAGAGTIWVAEGIYTRSGDSGPTEPVALLKDRIHIFGGFAGSETSLADRGNPSDHPSILDGQGTSSHVVVGASYCQLDGIQIREGNAQTTYGGGMYNYKAQKVVLTNCWFNNNRANLGGGVFNYYSSIIIDNCIFHENLSQNDGGGLYNIYCFPSVSNTLFSNNTATDQGGGIYSKINTSPTITNCNFFNNQALKGAGLAGNYYSSPRINNSTFFQNSAYSGGALYFESDCYPLISNTIFHQNYAINQGGAIFNYYDNYLVITNCIFTDNSANFGGGISTAQIAAGSILVNCTLHNNSAASAGGAIYIENEGGVNIKNSILWEDTSPGGNEIVINEGVGIWIYYSNVQGGFTGTGNIDIDPLFMGYPDLHLQYGSPCINSGTASGAPSYDLDGNPRPSPVGGAFDMGAYEYQWP